MGLLVFQYSPLVTSSAVVTGSVTISVVVAIGTVWDIFVLAIWFHY